MKKRPVVVLTGGPGGGKSTLIEDLRADPAWSGLFVALPETVHVARFANISPRDKLFQRVMVRLQMGLEDALDRALGEEDTRPIICHRGSLDPLAFWLQRGWSREEFFAFTGTFLHDHYRRYAGVIHLVSAADGASGAYARWPAAHRPEEADEAVWLDRRLKRAWSGHPSYVYLDNEGRDWGQKSREARAALHELLA